MLTFIAHATVRPEHRAAFEALVTYVRDMTRANEPGVAYYDFAISADRPDTYVVIEAYQDAAAHAAHMATAWVRDSLHEARSLVDGEIAIKRYVDANSAPVI